MYMYFSSGIAESSHDETLLTVNAVKPGEADHKKQTRVAHKSRSLEVPTRARSPRPSSKESQGKSKHSKTPEPSRIPEPSMRPETTSSMQPGTPSHTQPGTPSHTQPEAPSISESGMKTGRTSKSERFIEPSIRPESASSPEPGSPYHKSKSYEREHSPVPQLAELNPYALSDEVSEMRLEQGSSPFLVEPDGRLNPSPVRQEVSVDAGELTRQDYDDEDFPDIREESLTPPGYVKSRNLQEISNNGGFPQITVHSYTQPQSASGRSKPLPSKQTSKKPTTITAEYTVDPLTLDRTESGGDVASTSHHPQETGNSGVDRHDDSYQAPPTSLRDDDGDESQVSLMQ